MAKTYRLGSRGEGVRLLQRLLRERGYEVMADGDFGPKTLAAVKALQQKAGLTADGIVGAKTMAVLADVTITQAYISKHITRKTGRQVRYIAIHYTAGRSSTAGAAMANRNVFLTRQASADFVVDDTTIVQVNPNPDEYYCWAVGDKKNPWTGGARLNGVAGNVNTVSIEMCSTLRKGTSAATPNHDGWSFTASELELTRRLVRYLMLAYDIPRERVVRHYDITGKLCPGVPGWNDGPLYDTGGKALSGRNSGSEEWETFRGSL